MESEKNKIGLNSGELEKSHRNIHFKNEDVTISFKNKKMPKIKAKLSGKISIIEIFEWQKIALEYEPVTPKGLKKMSEQIEFEARGEKFKMTFRL